MVSRQISEVLLNPGGHRSRASRARFSVGSRSRASVSSVVWWCYGKSLVFSWVLGPTVNLSCFLGLWWFYGKSLAFSVVRRSWRLLGPSWGLLGAPGASWGTAGGHFGLAFRPLSIPLGRPGASWGLLGRSWGPFWPPGGLLWAPLGAPGASPGRPGSPGSTKKHPKSRQNSKSIVKYVVLFKK